MGATESQSKNFMHKKFQAEAYQAALYFNAHAAQHIFKVAVELRNELHEQVKETEEWRDLYRKKCFELRGNRFDFPPEE